MLVSALFPLNIAVHIADSGCRTQKAAARRSNFLPLRGCCCAVTAARRFIGAAIATMKPMKWIYPTHSASLRSGFSGLFRLPAYDRIDVLKN